MKSACTRRAHLAVAFVAATLAAAPLQAQTWVFKGVVASGEQVDAVAGADQRVHVVTSRYYQFDAHGTKLVDEAYPAADQAQTAMDYNPAIARDPWSNTHILSRRNGNWSSGYELWYVKRTHTGAWSSYKAANPVARNYQVGLAAADNGSVYFNHSTTSGGNVWGPVKFYREGGGRMLSLGEIANVARIDCDQLLRARGNELFFGSGKCDSGGASYFSRGPATTSPVAALSANLKTHNAGSDRRGFPAMASDAAGNFHVAYGASGAIYYNKYNAANAKVFSSDKLVFSGLGSWHLNVGLCSMTVSDDGRRVLIVALNPDGQSASAANAELRYSYSLNGGSTWSQPAGLGRYTNAGEGRCRPALVYLANKAFLFYKDRSASGTSLAILEPPRPAKEAAAAVTGVPAFAEWAARHLAAPAAREPAADPDGDGADNHSEYVADTDPANPASRFALAALQVGETVSLRVRSSAQRLYLLEYTDDPARDGWRALDGATPQPGTGATLALTDPTPRSQRLYRVRVLLPAATGD